MKQLKEVLQYYQKGENGIKCYANGEKEGSASKVIAHYADDTVVLPDYVKADRKIKDVKPYLFPLSSLTEEIEVNGERFVPLIRLAEMFAFDSCIVPGSISLDEYGEAVVWRKQDDIMIYFTIGFEVDKYGHTSEWCFRMCEMDFDEQKAQYVPNFKKEIRPRSANSMFIELLKWKFNVFGLSKDQFIEIKKKETSCSNCENCELYENECATRLDVHFCKISEDTISDIEQHYCDDFIAVTKENNPYK